MFRKPHFFLLSLFIFSSLSAQQNKLERAINEVKTNKHNSKIILEVEHLIPDSKDEKLNLEAYSVLGEAYKALEVYDKAYVYYIKALQLAQKNKLTRKIGLIKEDLGNIQVHIGNYKKSIQLYNDSKKSFQKIGDFDGMIRAKGNIAIVAIKTGHRQQAIQSLIEIKNEKQLNPLTKATTLLTLGNIHLEASETDKAITYYLEALSQVKNTDNDRFKILVNQNLAESYIALKQYDHAFFYNQKSEVLLEKNNSNELKSSLYFFYSEINKGKSQFKEAYKNLELYQKYKELSDNSKQALQIENIETLNKIENQKLDLQIKEQKITLLQNEKFIARIKIFCLILLLIAILILSIYLIKKQRKKVKTLSQTISQTEDKLEFSLSKTDKMVLNIVKNNDFIERFRENLKQIQTKINDSESKNELNKLIFELQNFKLINDTKDDLFNQVDAQFTYKLEKKYPELTDEERKICILIYLDLKNKDMAVILNLSVRSVENCRYRIRKKMNLAPNDNLSSILHNI